MINYKIYATTQTSHLIRICNMLDEINYHYSIIVSAKSTVQKRPTVEFEISQLDIIKDYTNSYRFVIVTIPCKTGYYKRYTIAHRKLLNVISNDYRFLSTYQKYMNMKAINIYTTQIIKKQNPMTLGIYLIAGGYGDFFRHVYLLQNYIKSKLDENYKIYIHYANKNFYSLHKLFFPNCIYKIIPNRLHIKSNINIKPYREIINLADIAFDNEDRLYQISKYINGSYDRNIDAIQLNHKLSANIYKNLIKRIRKKHNKVIGLQIHTTSINPLHRNYSVENAQRFIDVCIHNNIAICILTPYEGEKLQNCYDLSYMSIDKLPDIIKMLDCIVSIDSCCGHIAALMNTPSIIIFNTVLPYSQSVIRMNRNLVSKDDDVNSIKPEVIYKTLIGIFDETIKLPVELRRNYDILNDWNTEIV